MPARRLAQALLACAALGALVPACGPPPPAAVHPDTGACDPAALGACAVRLAAAGPDADRALVADYVAAREARDPSDPWARLFHALAEGKGPDAVLLVEGGATVDPAPRAARVIAVPALPAPGGVDADDLLLAMARHAGIPHVVHVRATEVTQLFPADPLAPFTAGLRPVLRDDGAPAHLDADIALARSVRTALDAAGAGQYLDAARAADAASAALAGRDPHAGPVLRARLALHLLGAAGLVLDPPPGAPAPAPSPAAAPPRDTETPYAAYLAVLAARDPEAAWEVRGPRVLQGVAADRRDPLTALHARAKGCAPRRAPPMERARDLVFANALAGVAEEQLPLAAWLERHDALVGLVAETRTAWSFLPALLARRGDAGGLEPAGSAATRRVTEMGLAHLGALRALAAAEPSRFRAFAPMGLGLAPGLLGDPALLEALVELTEASTRDRLRAAADPEALLGVVVTGALTGLSYPPALQEAHLGALHGAVAARLAGDLAPATGWSVAALHAADALYRLVTEPRPALSGSARQIARAAGAPGVEPAALGALAGAAARYAAMAAERRLDPPGTRAEKLPAERLAARASLRAALAGLGPPGEAPEGILDDLTELADGLLATLSTAMSAASAKKPPAGKAAAPVCGPAPAVALDPTTRRALARLGDVRRRLLGHPRLRQGDGAFHRRARLVATLLSDAMDLAIASDTRKPPVFAVADADADRAWHDALDGNGPRGLATAIAAGYALARAFVASPSPEVFAKQGGPALRRLAAGLLVLFQGDAPGDGGPAMGAALLEALAHAKGIGDDAGAALVAHARALYDRGQADQADLCLLASLLAGSITGKPPPEEAAALAEAHGSRVAWALRMAREIRREGRGGAPDPAAYGTSLRRAADDACQVPDADATLAVVAAAHDLAAGRRKEARAALEQVLGRAEATGLGVPRMAFRYEEKVGARVFSASVDVSSGSGLLLDGTRFQLGLGLRGGGAAEGSLTAALLPPGSAQAGEDAARLYVYAAALATVAHLLDGDTAHAVASGRRAVAALSQGLVLGPRRLRSARAAAWGQDARDVLAVAAQLAAEAGMAFLAGDLWTVVRQGFAETLDDRAVAAMLDPPPPALAGVPALAKPIERARRSLRVLAEPLPCTTAKVELGAYEEVGCDTYPLALSLRSGGALRKLPRLHRGPETTARCAPLVHLDAFLAGVARGTYDPDAFTEAVQALRADGRIDDAAVLLARQRRPDHCSPTLVAAARALGRTPSLGPSLRADLLASAVNCTAAAGGPEVEADVLALDDETRKLPDPARNLKLVLWLAERSARTDRWETLGRVVARPDFLGRWIGDRGEAAAAALVLDHAVATIRGQRVDLDRTKGTYQILCETFPAPARAEMCGQAAALRKPPDATAAPERQRAAREVVKRLVTAVSAAPGKGR